MPAADRTTERRPARRIARGLAWILFALVSLLSVPSAFSTLADDPDSGWRWALNELAQRVPVQGAREPPPIFPFGPLGYLERPDLPNFPAAAAVQTGLHLLLCASFVALLRRRATATILATTAVLFVVWAGRATDGLPLVVAWLLMSCVFDDRAAPPRRRELALGAWILLAALLTAIRPTSAAILLAMAIAALAARRFRPPVLSAIGWVAAAATATLSAAFLFTLFPSIFSFFDWARSSLAMGSQHSIAMSLEDTSNGILALGLAIPLLLATLGLIEARHPEARRALLFSALPLLWASFKHGFHRQDAHVLIFFSVAALVATALALRASPRTERAAWVLAAASLAALLAIDPLVREDGSSTASAAASILSGERLTRTVRDWGACAAEPCASAWRRAVPQVSPIPPGWLDTSESFTVDVVPYRLQRLFRPTELGDRWRPSPTLQLPMAFTPQLDDRVAKHFAERGPDRLIAEVAAIDGRAMFWDTPATWRSIQSWYRVRTTDRRWVYLERRESPRSWAFDEPIALAVVDDTIEIPPVDNEVWPLVALDLRLTLWGRLRNLLFRVEPVFLEYEARNGRTGRHRLIAANASQGLLATLPPDDGEDLERLLGAYRGRPIERLRLSGAGVSSYEVVGARLIPARLIDRAP